MAGEPIAKGADCKNLLQRGPIENNMKGMASKKINVALPTELQALADQYKLLVDKGQDLPPLAELARAGIIKGMSKALDIKPDYSLAVLKRGGANNPKGLGGKSKKS